MSGGGLPALEFWGIALGLREAVILLILLLTAYMVFVLLRMRRIRKTPAPPIEMLAPARSVEAQVKAIEPSLKETVDQPEASVEAAAVYQRPVSRMADAGVGFGMDQELLQLREEVDAMRGELAALRQDMQQEVARLHAAQSVSPIYGDAMQMAIAGYDPVMIADRCGIARGEAELVVALAKSQGQ